MVWDYILCFEAPGLIAQFSKCDFWNLEKMSDRNMKPDYVRPASGGGYWQISAELAQGSGNTL